MLLQLVLSPPLLLPHPIWFMHVLLSLNQTWFLMVIASLFICRQSPLTFAGLGLDSSPPLEMRLNEIQDIASRRSGPRFSLLPGPFDGAQSNPIFLGSSLLCCF